MARVRIGEKGRTVLPVEVRRAAAIGPTDELMATVEGPGRIVLQTRRVIEQGVWEAARPTGLDAIADVRELRREDRAIADANFTRQAQVTDDDDEMARRTGDELLAQLGL
jgi:bifunctional DNA-binding transcriptional regulator/antitoxin component of YhaV-PrlF toxin-antitoxin module